MSSKAIVPMIVACVSTVMFTAWGLFLLADGLFGIDGARGIGAAASVVGGLLCLTFAVGSGFVINEYLSTKSDPPRSGTLDVPETGTDISEL